MFLLRILLIRLSTKISPHRPKCPNDDHSNNIGTTVAALRERGHNCKVMVGGAVLTEDYARQLGADYYGKDASEALKIAKQFFETR